MTFRDQQTEVVIGQGNSSREDHGVIAGATDLSAKFTEHTGSLSATTTLTLTDFSESLPSSAFMVTITGGGSPTINLLAGSVPRVWTAQTLTALADGDYTALFTFDGTNYDVRVQARP